MPVFRSEGIPPHVYIRIAEHVQATTGMEVDTIEVMWAMHDDIDMGEVSGEHMIMYNEIQAEAFTYEALVLETPTDPPRDEIEVLDRIAWWHQDRYVDGLELHDVLCVSWETYALWVEGRVRLWDEE